MTAYAVHRMKHTGQRVVVLQYAGMDTGPTWLVAPLFEADPKLVMEMVTPPVELGGEALLVAVHLTAAVRRRDLGPAEGHLDAFKHSIAIAINWLFFGI